MKKTMLTAAMIIGCFFVANAKSSETNLPSSEEKEMQLNEKNSFHRIWVTTSCGYEFPIDTEPGETIGSILETVMVGEEFFCGDW